MIVTLKTSRVTLDDMRAFLAGTGALDLAASSGEGRRRWISDTLGQNRYRRLGRTDKGVVRAFVAKLTGLSRAQVTRLIGQWIETGRLDDRRGLPARPFACRYSRQDVALLVELDQLHGQLSGPATKKLAERACERFGDTRYKALSGISVAHLYNLRASAGYRRQRSHYAPTRPVRNNIGERRRPRPDGKPGYLRVDSVHQGDFDGVKGIYVINLVDAVTQFELVYAVPKITEHFLVPVLEHALKAFPFVIQGFHTDNGSEYINRRVASLLTKLQIEFTKCRPRRSNDNALVESKNASVVRKHLGYAHIPSRFADAVSAFTRDVLSPYLNYHRPCFFPETVIDDKGRQRRRYRYELLDTPYQKLRSLPDAETHLRPGVSFEQLDLIANAKTDNQAAAELNQERRALFSRIRAKSAA